MVFPPLSGRVRLLVLPWLGFVGVALLAPLVAAESPELTLSNEADSASVEAEPSDGPTLELRPDDDPRLEARREAEDPQAASAASASPSSSPLAQVPAEAALVGAGLSAAAIATAFVVRPELWGRFLGAWVGLFSRFQKNNVLEQATRGRVYAAIEHNPGVGFVQLKRNLNLSTGVLYHHLRMLQRHDLIRVRRHGSRSIYYLAGGPVPSVPLTASETRLLDILHMTDRASRKTLAAQLQITPQAVGYHAKRLHERGLLAISYEGRTLFCARPTPQ